MKRFFKRSTKDEPVSDETEPLRMEPADQEVVFTLGTTTNLNVSQIISTRGDGVFEVVEADPNRNLYRVKRSNGAATRHLDHYFITVM